MLKHIPNILTCMRIALVPCFVTLYIGGMHAAALNVFIAASVTDVLDGFIARTFHCISDVGKALDPLADKISLIGIALCLFLSRRIPVWMMLAMTARELLMIWGGIVLWRNHIRFAADRFGKITSVLFFCAAILLFPWHDIPALRWTGLTLLLFSLGFSIATFVHYYRIFRPMLDAKQAEADAR